MRSGRLAVSLSVTALLLGTAVLAAPSAGAREDGDSQRVRLIDDCDPATFNAAIGPGTCVKQGDTTFTDFLAQLGKNGNIANEAADDWEFKPGDFHVDAGATINAVNVGGEFHTFTRVANFGGGCVPVLNRHSRAHPRSGVRCARARHDDTGRVRHLGCALRRHAEGGHHRAGARDLQVPVPHPPVDGVGRAGPGG